MCWPFVVACVCLRFVCCCLMCVVLLGVVSVVVVCYSCLFPLRSLCFVGLCLWFVVWCLFVVFCTLLFFDIVCFGWC